MKSSCKDCTERHLACHDTCEVYQKYKAQRELVSKKRAETRIVPMYSGARKKDMIDAHRKKF